VICKVGICGVSGKMGLEIASLIQEGFTFKNCQFELTDAVAASDRLKSVEGISVRKVHDDPREPVHVWIDFSRPEGTLEILEQIHTPIVIGTTGFTEEQWKKVIQYAQKQPVLFAPNLAPGMNALMRMLDSSLFSPVLGFEAVAQESHHKHKKDAPSGTMKRILTTLENLGYQDVPVQVSRVGEVFGVHTLRFVSPDEEITIEHRVLNRRVFAKGALVAAQFLIQAKKPKIYSFAEVLES